MKALYVRSLTEAEQAAVQKAIRCSNTVTHRRVRIIALSEGGQRVAQIAPSVGMHPESVRRVIRAVNARELLVVLYPQPQGTGRPATFGEQVVEGLVELLHQSPRELGFETERWTLRDLAAAAPNSGLVPSISPASVWRLLLSHGYSWKQSKRRMSSPDPQYEEKRADRAGRSGGGGRS